MAHWNTHAPDPEWLRKLSDAEVVEEFMSVAGDPRVSHLRAARFIRAMRRRLTKIMLDGLAAKSAS